MVYILTNADIVLKAEVRPQESLSGDPLTKALLNLKLKRKLTQESFEEQQQYLSTSAIAVFMSLNKLDQHNRFRAGLHLAEQMGRDFNFHKGSSSSGLGYALALFECWWQSVLSKPGKFDFPVLATGEVLESGHVMPISHLDKKIANACSFVSQEEMFSNGFYICYPKQNEYDISVEQRQRVTELGGILVPVTRLQNLLHDLIGEHYDGDPLGRWAPFKGSESFHFEDSLRFFGRENEVREFVSEIKSSRGCVLLTGDPSVGKTSFFKSGVMPALLKEDQHTCFELYDLSLEKAGTVDSVIDYLRRIWGDELLDKVALSLQSKDEDYLDAVNTTLNESASNCFIFIDHIELSYFNHRSTDDFFLLSILANALDKLTIVFAIRVEFLDSLIASIKDTAKNIFYLSEMSNISCLKDVVFKQAHFSGVSFEVNDKGHSLGDVIVEESIGLKNRLLFISVLLKHLYEVSESGPHLRELSFKEFEAFGYPLNVPLKIAEHLLNSSNEQLPLLLQLFEHLIEVGNEGTINYIEASKENILLSAPELTTFVSTLYDKSLLTCRKEDKTTISFKFKELIETWPPMACFYENTSFIKWRRSIDQKYVRWIANKSHNSPISVPLSLKDSYKFGKENFTKNQSVYKNILNLKEVFQGVVLLESMQFETKNLRQYVWQSGFLISRRIISYAVGAFLSLFFLVVFV